MAYTLPWLLYTCLHTLVFSRFKFAGFEGSFIELPQMLLDFHLFKHCGLLLDLALGKCTWQKIQAFG